MNGKFAKAFGHAGQQWVSALSPVEAMCLQQPRELAPHKRRPRQKPLGLL